MTPKEDKGAFLAIGNAPSSVNVDYIQDAMKPYMKNVMDTPEVSFGMSIAGAPSSNGSLNIITLKDWKERDRKQAAVMNELNTKAKSIPEVSVSAFNFPEIDTGEQGPPIAIVLKTAQDYKALANTAENLEKVMKTSGKFIYTNLNLAYDTAQMTISVDKEKAGTYGITMQQISNTLGSFLSGATITRVDVDGRAYKVISQVKRDDR